MFQERAYRRIGFTLSDSHDNFMQYALIIYMGLGTLKKLRAESAISSLLGEINQ